jgi:hypothetical protein
MGFVFYTRVITKLMSLTLTLSAPGKGFQITETQQFICNNIVPYGMDECVSKCLMMHLSLSPISPLQARVYQMHAADNLYKRIIERENISQRCILSPPLCVRM